MVFSRAWPKSIKSSGTESMFFVFDSRFQRIRPGLQFGHPHAPGHPLDRVGQSLGQFKLPVVQGLPDLAGGIRIFQEKLI